MSDARHPVLVGVGQLTLRDQVWPEVRSPMDLMAEAAGLADRDAGGGVLATVDAVAVLNMLSWDYGDAPGLLAGTLGLGDGERFYTSVGGNWPQRLVNDYSARLARGELTAVLVAGAEVFAGKRRSGRAGHRLNWGRVEPPCSAPEERAGVASIEMAHRAALPSLTYPLIETAVRAAAGRPPDVHRKYLGELMAPFTRVAVANPHAWFPVARSPEDVSGVSPENRMVALPYTKRMNAVLEVDQAAALLLTTAGHARAVGVPEDRWVWVLGGGDCNDVWNVSERPTLGESPAIRRAAQRAWETSGLGIDDMAHLDVYSCFPSAVQLGRDALGIGEGDCRPLTVTGGLPYFGGPGNNYVTHAIASMVRRLRHEPGSAGACTALGWFATKHSVGVYASRPPTRGYERVDPGADQAEIDARPHPALEDHPEGPATIVGYTVGYDKENAPQFALVIADSAGQRRTMALSFDPDLVAAVHEGEWVGRAIQLRPAGDGTNVFVTA